MAADSHASYQSPFSNRYGSEPIRALFSYDKKFTTWRRLWVALAESEQQLGLTITDQQIAELRNHINDVNYTAAEAREREVRHDVMAHVYAYGQQCPSAAGIIHLGATSMYVDDNTDIIIMRDALLETYKKALGVVKLLSRFAEREKATVILGSTHGQPAQLVTVGKRATLWIQDFVEAAETLLFVIDKKLKFLGCKGTTGTQESFMKLFDGDETRVQELDQLVAQKMGFLKDGSVFPISAQTYPRTLDAVILDALKYVAIAAYKFAQDIRLLQRDKEVEEPFGKSQIGSSAMAYKRNPMRS